MGVSFTVSSSPDKSSRESRSASRPSSGLEIVGDAKVRLPVLVCRGCTWIGLGQGRLVIVGVDGVVVGCEAEGLSVPLEFRSGERIKVSEERACSFWSDDTQFNVRLLGAESYDNQ